MNPVDQQDSDFFYVGDHPTDHFGVHQRRTPPHGLFRTIDARFSGVGGAGYIPLTTDELDALDDYEETLGLLGQPDYREKHSGVSQVVRLGMGAW